MRSIGTVKICFARSHTSPRLARSAACNPLLIWSSQEARSYSLLVLLTAGALLGAVVGRCTRRRSACQAAFRAATARRGLDQDRE